MLKKVLLVMSVMLGIMILLLALNPAELWDDPTDIKIYSFTTRELRKIEGLKNADSLFHVDVCEAIPYDSCSAYGTYEDQNLDGLVETNSKWTRINAGNADIVKLAEQAVGTSWEDFNIGYLLPDIVYEYAYTDLSWKADYAAVAFFAPNYHCFVFHSIYDAF